MGRSCHGVNINKFALENTYIKNIAYRYLKCPDEMDFVVTVINARDEEAFKLLNNLAISFPKIKFIAIYQHAHSESEQINYVDFVSDLTSGIGQMITVISIVLIIFASISLAVSCVMTGIITYTSVLERTKEIGILRAVGARKKDVGRLFEAESTIIGGVSGIIGCAVSYLITIPINQILNHRYPDYNLGNIADLSLFHDKLSYCRTI